MSKENKYLSVEARAALKECVESTRIPLAKKREEGMKFDGGKIRMELLPFEALEAVAEVLTFGATIYVDDNWQLVNDAEKRYTGAMLRHLVKHQCGKLRDDESKLLHIAHVATNALFLVWFEIQKQKEAKREIV